MWFVRVQSFSETALMRISILSALAGMIALLGVSAFAADSSTVKGMFLITDYPTVTAQRGRISTIRLKLQNCGLRSAAVPALRIGRAGWRDAARRRPAGRGRNAGDRRECGAPASPRHSRQRRYRQPDADRQCRGQGRAGRAADHGDLGEGASTPRCRRCVKARSRASTINSASRTIADAT